MFGDKISNMTFNVFPLRSTENDNSHRQLGVCKRARLMTSQVNICSRYPLQQRADANIYSLRLRRREFISTLESALQHHTLFVIIHSRENYFDSNMIQKGILTL